MRTISLIIALSMLISFSLPALSLISEDNSIAHGETRVWEMDLHFDDPIIHHYPEGISIEVQGLDNDQRPGALSLPRLTLDFQIPVDSDIVTFSLVDGEYENMDPEGAIQRNLPDVPSADLSLWDRVQVDIPVPVDHFEYDLGTGLDLDTRETMCKVSVGVYPCVPDDGGIRFLRSGKLKMEYIEPESDPIVGDVTYDLLVITPDEFADEMDLYSDYRNQTGIDTIVITLSDIIEDRIWNITGTDIAEEMKLFIMEARLNWSVDSVLLVGDVNVMPAREIMVLDGYDDGGNSDGRFLPSDLYFADLFEEGTTEFCTWNDRVDDYHVSLWGEYNGGNLDGVDLYPDVIIGRIPASSEAELDLMLEKLQQYELTAMGSEWFQNATVCGTNTFVSGAPHYDTSGINEGEYMSDIISSGPLSEFNSTKHYESLGNLNSIATTVDKGCGFFEMSDHGGYDGWGYAPGASVTNSLAYGLDNGFELPVVVLDACLTHGFDNDNATGSPESFDPVYGYSYYPPGSARSWMDCLGEQFHKAPNGGAVATFGCTRVGYGAYGTSYATRNSGYVNLHIHEAYADGYIKAGEMLAKALEDYIAGPGPSGSASFKTLTEFVLLGDPTLTVGGVNGANIEIASETIATGLLPNITKVIEFNMTNTGFLSSNVSINAVFDVGDTGSWIFEVIPGNVEIGSDQVIDGTLSITAPENAIMGTEKTIVIRVSSPLMSEPATLEIDVILERSFGLDVETDPGSASTVQAGTVGGHLNLTNRGNGPEEIELDFTGLPVDWELELGSEIVEMVPFEEERVPFRITLPPECIAGNYRIPITCSSILDPATASTNLTIKVDADHELDLEVISGRIDIGPGEEGAFIVNVKNLGNSDVSVDLGLGRTVLPGWNLSISEEIVTVPAFSNVNVTVNVGSPALVSPRTYQIYINATDGESSAQTNAVINITKLFSFEISCDEPEKVQDGTVATYFDIDIHNQGNIYDIYEVSSNLGGKEGWSFNGELPEVSIESDIVKSFRVTFSNTFPLCGNYTFPVTVSPGSGIPARTIYLTVVVPTIFNFTASSMIEEPRALPGEEIGGIISISTISNCRDSYIIQPILEDGFTCTLEEVNLTLDVEGSLTLNFSVRSSKDALAGPYPLRFKIISQGSGWSSILTETIHVDEVYGMTLEVVSGLTGELKPGSYYEIILRLLNTGNTPDNADIDLNCSGYVQKWVRLEGSYFASVDPGENRTVRIVIVIPTWNVTEGEYNISICMSSLGEDVDLGNYTLKVLGSKDENGNGSFDWTIVIVAGIVAFIIILTVIIMGVMIARRNAAMDVDEAGLEWESDDDDEEDWDDWED